MAFDRRHTAAAIVGLAGIAGAFVLVPDPLPVLTVAAAPGESAYTSIQEAVDALGPRGGTVEVQEGTYAERVVLDGRRGVSLRARTGDRVVIDASGITPPEGTSGVIEVHDGGLVEIAGLELTGYRAPGGGEEDEAVPVGLLVTGNVEGLTVEDLTVHDISAGLDEEAGDRTGEAYGLAVLGDDPGDQAIEVVITGTAVRDLTLGSGAGILVDGNVSGWEVTGSRVHDVDGVGVRVTGHGTTVGGDLSGDPTYRPRNGIVAGNSVLDVSGRGNVAYGPEGCLCAAAISIDGALGVALSDNSVERADVGIEIVAREPEGSTEGVEAVENSLLESRSAGIVVGGAEGADHGSVSRLLLRGNQLRGAPTEAMVRLGTRLTDVRFSSNELDLTRPGPVLLDLAERGPVLDLNVYVAAEPVFRLGQREVTELRAWQLLTRQDAMSTVRVP